MILLDDNKRFREHTGVEKFHKAGYYGQRVTAATTENWDLTNYNPDGLVVDPLSIGAGNVDHAKQTAYTFFQAAPKCRLLMLPNTGRYFSDGTYESELIDKGLDTAIAYGATAIFSSQTISMNGAARSDLDKKLSQDSFAHLKWYVSVGNEGESGYSQILRVDKLSGVGAYDLSPDGVMTMPSYSSRTEYIDFAAPTGIRVNFTAASPSISGAPCYGTSFSCPWLCGMACLIDDFFIAKTGLPLTRESMYQFFKDHSTDISTAGFDDSSGWGAVILPDPNDIDIDKYRSDDMTFTDKDQMSSWAVDDIEYCVARGLMEGVGGDRFDPQGLVTREQLACIIARYDRMKYKS